jgi:hypothetical protein
MPPVERARIADFANPPEPNRLLQANMQSWHPTHRSESTTSRRVNFGIFLFISFFMRIVKILISGLGNRERFSVSHLSALSLIAACIYRKYG